MITVDSLRGISVLQRVFTQRHARGGKVFIQYIVAGDPDAVTSFEIAKSLCSAGIDILELGMPFSDPMADGPVNQRAAQRALQAGMTFGGLLDMVKRLRSEGIQTPIICMTYVNPLMKRGYANVAKESVQAGLDGFIVVDLPPEEGCDLQTELIDNHLAMVYLLAPTSTDERMKRITSSASGFLYYVSRTGVTGVQDDIASDLRVNLSRIKACTDLPVVVGFGIKSPQQASEIAQYADGVVVGSALVQRLETSTTEEKVTSAIEFVTPLLTAVHGQ